MITARLNYAIATGAKQVSETFGPDNMYTRTTGAVDAREVALRDGRREGPFALETHGFTLVEHKTAMTNFLDAEELKRVYYTELEALVKKISGAVRVFVFDHTLRSSDESEREAKLIRDPAFSVHNDYTERSGPQRVRDLLPDEADRLLARRFAIIQVWRAIDQPIQRNPLAMADARTLRPSDLVLTERRYPNRVGEIYRVRYNPEHRWFYFPEMRRDEALVFKVYDSASDGRARFTAHTSFEDPTSSPSAPARRSIEARVLAFF